MVRKAVALGCPLSRRGDGTLFAARYRRLHEHGAVAPGFVADLVAVPDLEHFRPTAVWKRGRMGLGFASGFGLQRGALGSTHAHDALSDRPAEEVAGAVERMEAASHELGARIVGPFMTMSFIALSVIPKLKITDRGLVDTVRFELVPLEA